MATLAAAKEWRNVFADPQDVIAGSHEARRNRYNVLWSYYANTAFEDITKWAGYRSTFGLYRHTRSLYNPVQRIVDFYVNHVYPGVLSEDGSRLPAGIQLAIPLADDTDPELKSAISQFWQWSNWQDGMGLMVNYGAVAGSVLVEVIDETERGKVTSNVVWPGLVSDLELDATGNVKFYALEYDAIDEKGQQYTYRKEVDAESFRTFKDDKPFGFGDNDSEYENPYGFVPAVWAKQRNQGSDFGVPAVGGDIPKIDELNSLASHINDHIHKVINSPMIITGGSEAGSIVPLFEGRNDKRNLSPADVANSTDRQSVTLLKGPLHTDVKFLTGNLDLKDSLPYVHELLKEIERDFPELTFYERMAEMREITGPAADRLAMPVKGRFQRAASNYDQQSIKLFQMAVAIGGWRANRGDWKGATKQQFKFAPFDLLSYQKGELDFAIMPRPLLSLNEAEMIDIDLKRAQAVNEKAEYLDEVQILTELGYDEDKRTEILKRKAVKTVPPIDDSAIEQASELVS